MAQANTFLNIWGPALLVCFTVVVGLFFQNTRMNDQNARMNDLNARINDLKDSLNKRIDDLKTHLDAEFRSVHQRIDRLEIPVGRK